MEDGSIVRLSMRSISDQTTEIEARRTARNDEAATTATAARVKLEQARLSVNSTNDTRPILLMRTKADGRGRLGQHTPLDTGRGGLIPGVALKELFCSRHNLNSAVSGPMLVLLLRVIGNTTRPTHTRGY
jgi:hypothetical protein